MPRIIPILLLGVVLPSLCRALGTDYGAKLNTRVDDYFNDPKGKMLIALDGDRKDFQADCIFSQMIPDGRQTTVGDPTDQLDGRG